MGSTKSILSLLTTLFMSDFCAAKSYMCFIRPKKMDCLLDLSISHSCMRVCIIFPCSYAISMKVSPVKLGFF